jgi:hypothetical protein
MDDQGAMIPKYPPEGGARDKAGKAVDVKQAFDFCHADIVTEFWSRARRIFSGFLQGIRALKAETYPLKITKSLLIQPSFHPTHPALALWVADCEPFFARAGFGRARVYSPVNKVLKKRPRS